MNKVLVVGPSWVGDMVMAQSLYMSLHHQYPGVSIDVLAPAWSGPILSRMPEVRRHVEMPVGHGVLGFSERRRIGIALRDEGYDQAIVIPRSFKSALVPFFAKIPVRTGYRGEMRYGLINDMRTLDKSVLKQTVQRYVALGLNHCEQLPPDNLAQPSLIVNIENQERLRVSLELPIDAPLVGFVPGAEYGLAKRWPPGYFAELARRLVIQGKQVLLLGSAKDQAVCDEIKASAGDGVISLAGKTSLEDVVDVIAMTEQVVTNDSGLMHIAAATGRKVIAIYGSSTPDYTPPLTQRADILYLSLDCSPCFERECPKGHYRCLTDISVEMVLDKCQQ